LTYFAKQEGFFHSQTVLPHVETVKYLGLHFVRSLNWKVHITKKRKQTYLKAKEINRLIGRKSNLSLENKLPVYKAVIKPIWTYGIELWGCASKSNTAIMQTAQSKILRTASNAPWYVTNYTLHTDLKIPYVNEVINERINRYLSKLEYHPNPIVDTLTQPTRNRRLRRRWTSDLHTEVTSLDGHPSKTLQQDSKLDYRLMYPPV
jgi:hypothetical protein